MSSGSGSKGSSSSSSRVQIPRFLRPFIEQGAAVGSRSLNDLEGLLGSAGADDLVAGFSGPQQIAQVLGVDRALDPNGLFAQAQQTVSSAAGGQDLSQFIPQSALDTLTSGGSGIPDDILSRLSTGGALPGVDRLENLNSGLPQSVIDRLSQDNGVDTSAIQSVLGSSVDTTALNRILGRPGAGTTQALQDTANGDFLFGGDGFNAAVDAAVRAATPGITSQFGRQGGTGAATGGLAQTAIAQAGIDAFAGQFANERRNQLGADETLANLGLAERSQNTDIASILSNLDVTQRGQDAGLSQALANFGLAGNDQNLDAAQILGNLGLSETGQEADIASRIAELNLAQGDQDLSGASILANLFDNNENRSLSSADILSQLGLRERSNQLNAATQLPGLATADLDLLNNIGIDIQDLNQRRLTSPIDAQLQLLQAALGGVPIESLLGQRNRGRSSSLTLGFGGN